MKYKLYRLKYALIIGLMMVATLSCAGSISEGESEKKDDAVSVAVLKKSALEAYKAGDYKRAEISYREILENTPDDVHSLNDFALLLLKLGKYEESINLSNRVIDLTKDKAQRANAWFNKGKTFEKMENNTEALEAYRQSNLLLTNKARRDSVDRLSKLPTTIPGGFSIKEGKQYELCNDFLEIINRIAPKTGLYCGSDVWFDKKAKEKGFRLPAWEEVSVVDNKKTLYESFMYNYKGYAAAYRKKKEEYFYNDYINNEKIRLYRGKVDINNDGEIDHVYRFFAWGCDEKNSPWNFIVDKDWLFDEKFGGGGGDVFLYKGRAFLSRFSGAYIVEPFGRGGVVNTTRSVCRFTDINGESK